MKHPGSIAVHAHVFLRAEWRFTSLLLQTGKSVVWSNPKKGGEDLLLSRGFHFAWGKGGSTF